MTKLTSIAASLSILILAVFCLSFTDAEKNSPKTWQGIASYYHPKFNGRKTSTGEIFSNSKFTAANNFLRLGTLVRITNPANGKSVVVKINDRMNKHNKRLIDLSEAAAKKLGLFKQGIGQVIMEVVDATPTVKNLNSLATLR
jgi:rare lipoprotein A